MRTRIMRATAFVMAIVLPAAIALAHGGGGHGGGGGGGGHFSGGGGGGVRAFSSGGGGGGGSMRSFSGGGGTSVRSFSGGGNSVSGGGNTVRSFSGGSNAGQLGSNFSHHTGTSNFVKNNFPTQSGAGALNHQVNRINSNLGNNSFVHKQNITSNSPNNWTHKGNFANSNNLNKGNVNWNKGNWNNNNWSNNWNHHHGGFSPWIGWGLWWPTWGWGWGWPWGWGFGYPLYGYNYYGYGGYGYADNYVAAAPPAAVEGDLAAAGNFAEQGEADFKAGQYQAAIRDWQHALVDDPKNGAVILLMSQALFALGQYDEAAGATQAAMQALPEEKWGVVVSNYTQLYGNPLDYNDQIKALEKARDAKPDSPAIHFLLGFHFGYLGYPKHAVKELDKALTLAPKDLGSRKLRDLFAAKWPEAPPLPAAAVEAAKELEKEGGAPPAGQPQGVPADKAPQAPAAEPPGTPS